MTSSLFSAWMTNLQAVSILAVPRRSWACPSLAYTGVSPAGQEPTDAAPSHLSLSARTETGQMESTINMESTPEMIFFMVVYIFSSCTDDPELLLARFFRCFIMRQQRHPGFPNAASTKGFASPAFPATKASLCPSHEERPVDVALFKPKAKDNNLSPFCFWDCRGTSHTVRTSATCVIQLSIDVSAALAFRFCDYIRHR